MRMWQSIDKLPHVRTEYEFLMQDGSAARGQMFPNGTFETMAGEEMPRPAHFREAR